MKKSGSLVLLVLLVLLSAPGEVIFPQIVETVEVEGRIFSNESHSKNMVFISARDLEELKIKDMADLFSYFTAVNISKRGPAESSFDITMRGSNFEQVLVLVNGVPLNNPQTGHFNGDFPFSVGDVGRVEILRGGSSTTYGGGAFAGVINIILKKTVDFHFSAAGGENKFASASLRGGKQFKNLRVNFSLNRANSAGFHKGREFDQLKLTAGSSYKRKNTEMDFFTGYLEKDFGARGFYAPLPSGEEIKSYFYRFHWRQSYKRFNYSLTYSYNRHEDYFILDRQRPDYFQSESDTSLRYLNVTAAYKGERLSAAVGMDVKRESMDSSTMGFRKRNRGAVFLNLNYLWLKSGGIDVGIRRNMLPEGYGDDNFTFYSGIFFRMGGGGIFRAGYGKSFRLGSFTELYYRSPANIGNGELEPEVSHNFETSFSLLRERYQFDISLFYRNQENLIDWVRYPGESVWRAENIDKNDIVGIELTQRFVMGRTTISLGIERLTAVNKQIGFESKYGFRFPDFSVKMNVVQPVVGRVRLAVNYMYKRIYKTSEKGHFMNVVLSVPVGKVELSLRVDNVFNTKIEEIPGLRVPGRWIYLGISY